MSLESAEIIDCERSSNWEGHANIRNLQRVYRTARIDDKLWIKLRSRENNKLSPPLKVKGVRGSIDRVVVPKMIWKLLGGKDDKLIRVVVEPSGSYPWLKGNWVRLKGDKTLRVKALESVALALGFIGSTIFLPPPWNLLVGIAILLTGLYLLVIKK